jgi:RNA polymerase sigma-70 factor (ECF subfamily)
VSAPAPNRPGEPDLAELVDQHQTAIWRYLRFLGCEPGLADDLTQETFLAVIGRPLHRFGPAGARAYLRRVARNLWLKLRATALAAPASVDVHTAELAYEWFRREPDEDRVLTALQACLGELPDAARTALGLRFADGLDRGAIAARLALGVEGVKSVLQRAYARLRVCIERRLT